VLEKSSSTQNVPDSEVQIIVFRDIEVGPFTTDQLCTIQKRDDNHKILDI